MTKMAMAALLVGSFFYAVWLVVTRRAPDARGAIGKRRIFLFMTLYFMAWMGASTPAGETAPGRTGGSFGSTGETEAPALAEAWKALDMVQRHSSGEMVGDDEQREAWRRDKARYDEELAVFQKNKSELYLEMQSLEYCPGCSLEMGNVLASQCRHESSRQRKNRLDRYKAVKKLYEQNENNYPKMPRRMEEEWEQAGWGENNRIPLNIDNSRFAEAVREEKARGRLSEAAAELLLITYDNLKYHSRRKLATCYITHPPEYKPREMLEVSINTLARAAAQGPVDEAQVAVIRNDIVSALSELQRLRFAEEYEHIPRYSDTPMYRGHKPEPLPRGKNRRTTPLRYLIGYDRPSGMEWEIDERMQDSDLINTIDETSRVITTLAREMPKNWSFPPHE